MHPSAAIRPRRRARVAAAMPMLLAIFALAAPAGAAARPDAAAPRDGSTWVVWTDHGPGSGAVTMPQEPSLAAEASAACPGAMPLSNGRRLTFQCVTGSGSTGWTTADRSAIGRMLSAAYARQVALYGPPMHSHTVTIRPDASLNGLAYYQATFSFDGSGHVTSCRAVIHINPADGRDPARRIHFLTHETLHAFHGCQAPPADPVEEGMTEAAASLLRKGVANDLQVAWNRPNEPNGVYVTNSGVTIADQYNDSPLLSAARWYDTNDQARPQLLSLYSSASVYWWTLWRATSSFFRDWNSRWLAQDDLNDSAATRFDRVHAIAAQVLPHVGFMSYAEWRSRQRSMTMSHPAGTRTLCADASTQRADGYMDGLVQVVSTNGAHDDVRYSGDVTISMVRPDGSNAFAPASVDAGSMDPYGFLFDHMAPGGAVASGQAGAYRLTVQVTQDLATVTIGRCWYVGGLKSRNRLIVVGDPAQTVKVTVPQLVDGHVDRVTLTQAVGADRVAIFRGVKPGLAAVGLDGAPPMKVVAIGTRGAVAAVIDP